MIETHQSLLEFLSRRRGDFVDWSRQQWQGRPEPFYCSFDVRDSGHKIASVDANLFPGGFNNLHPDCDALAAAKLRDAATAFCDDLNGLLLIAEKIDRNPFYLEHILRLSKLLQEAGIPTRICRSDIHANDVRRLKSHSGQEVEIFSLERRGRRLHSGSWSPCAVLLNDDLSRADADEIALYENIEQTILPLPALGWFQRRKSSHFRHYHDVVSELCAEFSIDEWLLDPLYRVCQKIDIGSRVGLDCVASHCRQLLESIKESYSARGISDKPMCFVKSDHGTHGLGIMQIEDPEQVYALNRRQRKSMSFGKSGTPIDQVLIQECLPSARRIDGHIGEHVFYAVHNTIVGAFTRTHPGKSPYQSLNSPGMAFAAIAPGEMDDELMALQAVAELALLAAGREHQELLEGASPHSARHLANFDCPDDPPRAATGAGA